MYSKEIGGVLLAITGIVLTQTLGFTADCSNEIQTVAVTLLGGLPGFATTWLARVSKKDVTLAGFKKRV